MVRQRPPRAIRSYTDVTNLVVYALGAGFSLLLALLVALS